jgi:hypothetical protein
MNNFKIIKRSLASVAVTLLVALPLQAFAVNDVTIANNTDFQIETSDTAALTTITASAGGQVTNFDVQPDYIDITIDNASTVTFNVVTPSRFFKVTKQSGSTAYTVTPVCPTTAATLTGTGAQVVLRLELTTTNNCTTPSPPPPPSGSAGGRSSATPSYPTLSTTPSNQLQTFDGTVDVPGTGEVVRPTLIENSVTGAGIFIPADTLITTADGQPYNGTISPPSSYSESLLPAPLPDGLTFDSAIFIKTSGEIFFSQNVTLTIPLPAGTDLTTVKVYYYNEATKKYELVGDGGTVSADGKFISVKTNHLSVFVAAEGNPPASTIFFTDITGHWAEAFINNLHTSCAVNGYVDKSGNLLHLFKPDNKISRAELIKIIAQCKFGGSLAAPASNPFPDVSASHWAAPAIAKGKELGWVKGYSDGTFRPDQLINRAEALKIILLAEFDAATITGGDVSVFSDVNAGAWYAKYVAYAVMKGYINGYLNTDGSSTGKFGPGNNITRAETAKIGVNALGL